ncbi:MAG: hypothetical protein ACYCT9_13165 [Leptospirillum sp.]
MRSTRYFRARLLAMLTLLSFSLTSCTSFYTAKPVPLSPPSQLTIHANVPKTNLLVGVRPYNTPHMIHKLFDHNGLWRMHILPLQMAFMSTDLRPTTFLIRSSYIVVDGHYYPSIVPNEAFDISWQAKHPYILVKQTFYYTGLILFTLVTLGLGSVIWVLPTPFGEPPPQNDPFGRDLTFKAFDKNVTLQSGALRGGFLYFSLPEKNMNLKGAQLVLHFSQKSPAPIERTLIIPLKPGLHLDNNLLKQIFHGFF